MYDILFKAIVKRETDNINVINGQAALVQILIKQLKTTF